MADEPAFCEVTSFSSAFTGPGLEPVTILVPSFLLEMAFTFSAAFYPSCIQDWKNPLSTLSRLRA